MTFSFNLDEVAALVGASAVEGSTSLPITGIASLKQAKPGDLSFATNKKYAADLAATEASVVLLPPGFEHPAREGRAVLRVADPNAAVSLICRKLEMFLWPAPAPGVHPTAVVDPAAHIDPTATVGPQVVIEAGAKVGPRTHLEAGVFLGRNSTVGTDCWIGPRVVIYAECSVGSRVRIHAGTVLGADGFGYEFVQGRHQKVPQVGTVIIEDDVEIGASTCVDRARFGTTRIGAGSKLDNLVQIGHNVQVGRHCILVAQVAIAGSTVLEDYVMVGGQAGIAGHLNIGMAAKIAAQSGVGHDVPAKGYVMGTPAIEAFKDQKFALQRHRFPEVLRRLDALECKVFPDGRGGA
jgi:UDP-3-O-[3-hydroxymyristoyl] glucosamine N-acyltransferase